VRRSILVLPEKIICFWQRPGDFDGSHVPVHPDDTLDELEREKSRVSHDCRTDDLLFRLRFQLAHQGTEFPQQSWDGCDLNYLDIGKIKQKIKLLLPKTTPHIFFESHPVHVRDFCGMKYKVKSLVRPNFCVEHFYQLLVGCI